MSQFSQEQFVWYILDKADQNKAKGPFSERDLDVMMRTSQINSSTYVWKEGLENWEKLISIPELSESVLDSQKEFQNIRKSYSAFSTQETEDSQAKPESRAQQQTAQKSQTPMAIQNLQQQKLQAILQQQLLQQQVQQLNLQNAHKQEAPASSDPPKEQEVLQSVDEEQQLIFEKSVDTLIKNNYYQDEFGIWNIYDESNKCWKKQMEEPKKQMEELRKELLASLNRRVWDDTQKKNKRRDLTGLTEEEKKKVEKNRKKTKKQQEKKKLKLLHDYQNTCIYVSGLPQDVTEEELEELFQKAGIIRRDIQGEPKIKVYQVFSSYFLIFLPSQLVNGLKKCLLPQPLRIFGHVLKQRYRVQSIDESKDLMLKKKFDFLDEKGRCKGDAFISYAKEESVSIALDMLNERDLRPGIRLKVERAQFDPSKEKEIIGKPVKREKKIDKMLLMKSKAENKRLYGWQDEDQIYGPKIVVFTNMFQNNEIKTQTQEEYEKYFEELEADVKQECQIIGEVKRIRIFRENPKGIIEIKFKDHSSAAKCIELMDGRFYNQKKIECFYWDGKTDYKRFQDTQEDLNKRVEDFGAWIDSMQ